MRSSENAITQGWVSKKEKPSTSGFYNVANKYKSFIVFNMPYSKKYNMFGVKDEMSAEEVEEYLSNPFIKKFLLDDSGWWWKPQDTTQIIDRGGYGRMREILFRAKKEVMRGLYDEKR